MLAPKKKKKKKHKEADNSNDPIEEEEPVVDPNIISTSDAETEDGAEPEKDAEKNDPPQVREEEAPDKRKYTREDFLARRHGKEREPWMQKSMPFPGKSLKTKEEEHYNKFCEWMKPLFLQIPSTDAIKLPPYSKYMKDIVTNKDKFLMRQYLLCLPTTL